jgi:hypothetical protein
VEKTLKIKADITLEAVTFGKGLLNLQIITWVSLELHGLYWCHTSMSFCCIAWRQGGKGWGERRQERVGL